MPSIQLRKIKKELYSLGSDRKAKLLQKFFKTGRGEYGEGDVFIGVTVPKIRNIVKENKDLALIEVVELLHSKEHELRLTALLILVNQFSRGNDGKRKIIFNAYLNNIKYINNWDLIDLTAHHIIGRYLDNKNRDILKKLAKSPFLWKRRIAVLSTFYYIKNNDFKDSIEIAEILLKDKEDLIHKAVGWMLREVWKRSPKISENFINKNIRDMSRTTLRYAIEKMPELKHKKFLLK